MEADLANAIKRMLKDPYMPGTTHGGKWPEDLGDLAKDMLWNKSYKEFTITVRRSDDNYHINYTIDGRSNGTETS
tara:strand:- start:603 stop:827 length:225 start_codon:yes stop_codon:yes gene_type:complete